MNFKILFYLLLIIQITTFYTFAQSAEEVKQLVESYKKIIENRDKKIQNIKSIESVFNISKFTGYVISWNENRRPIRVVLSLENSESSEYQIFEFDIGMLVFAFISFVDHNGWQFYFSIIN